MPRIDDLLDKLRGALHSSALDLTSRYYQLAMHPSDIPKTSFVTPEGAFEFKVLSQGLSNSPAVFAQTMSPIFKPLLNKSVLICAICKHQMQAPLEIWLLMALACCPVAAKAAHAQQASTDEACCPPACCHATSNCAGRTHNA